mgnify:CR=1 FL=1
MRSSVNDMLKRGKLSRRDFLRLLRVGAIDLSLLAAGGAVWSFLLEPNWVKIEHINLKLPRLTPEFSGMRVAQVSDIHMGGWMNAERLQRVADLVVEQKPNLLLLTGDFLVGHFFDKNPE